MIELNEAFAAQALAVLRELGLAGRCARTSIPTAAPSRIGHPLGMSGARLVTTAINQLHRTGGRYALCTMCIGVGPGHRDDRRAGHPVTKRDEQRKQQHGLEPIETASRDELRALQLERLQWSLRHAYDNVGPYREKCRGRGRPSRTTCDARGPRQVPVHQQSRTCATTTRSACSRCRANRSCASTPPAARPASRPSSATRGATSTHWADLVARSIRAAGGRPGDRCHVAYGYGLFTGGLGAHYGAERLGCTVIPMSGGQTEKQVQLIQDFKPRIIMVTPSYMLNIVEEMERVGHRPALDLARGRHLRRRALDRPDAPGRSRPGSASTRSTSTACRR